MSIYKTNIEVDIHDIDPNGVARASALMRYIQSCAQSQLSEGGMSYDELKNMGRAFILSKIKMEFTSPVRVYDRLTACTYPCESRGYSFLRCYAIERGEEVIGRAVSVWALIDTQTRSLVKVDDFNLGLEVHDSNGMALQRFYLPSELCEVGTYTVNYADLDQNGHMNNTRYPDMYSNFLPLDGYRIEGISINYLNEAPRGEKLRVYSASQGDIFYIRTIREDGKVNSEAEIKLASL